MPFELLSKRSAWRMMILLAVPTLIAVTCNLLRPEGLPFIATEPYEIFTDCPEATAQADSVSLKDARTQAGDFLLVDGRAPAQVKAEPIDGAIAIAYDELFPVSAEDVSKLAQARGERVVLVIADEAATAKLLADDLRSQGVLKVRYLNARAQDFLAGR